YYYYRYIIYTSRMLFNACSMGKWIYLLAFNVITIVVFAIAIKNIFIDIDPNTCSMTYMQPVYYLVPTNHTRYKLYLYREAPSVSSASNAAATQQTISRLGRSLRGMPVLFIPGNSGSYKQIRSIGAEAYSIVNRQPTDAGDSPSGNGGGGGNKKRRRQHIYSPSEFHNELDIFTLDFEEELSALGGDVMYDETEYVNECIKIILGLYQQPQQQMNTDTSKPTSVILIGHSMGGIVARMSVLLPNHIYGSVTTIITLNSSHRNAPIYSHQSTSHFYHELNRHWSESIQPRHFEFNDKGELTHLPPIYDKIVVVSVGGGHRDTLIRSELTSLDGIVSADRSFSVITTSMPDVFMETDHQCILWCNEVVLSLVEALLLLAHPNSKQNTYDSTARLDRLKAVMHSHAPEVLGIAQLSDNSKYMESLKTMPKEDMQSIGEIVERIPYEQAPMLALLHRPSLNYQTGPTTRFTSSSSPNEAFYINYRIADWAMPRHNSADQSTTSFALTTSLSLGEFIVILYDPKFERAVDISYRAFAMPTPISQAKSTSQVEAPAAHLTLPWTDIKNYHSLFIAFPKASRRQKFVAYAQFYNATESLIDVPSVGMFNGRRYTLPAGGHPMVVNFSLPFYNNKYPLKVRLSQMTEHQHQPTTQPTLAASALHPVFLPITYHYIPRSMEEGKFVANCTQANIKFHQSSRTTKVILNHINNINIISNHFEGDKHIVNRHQQHIQQQQQVQVQVPQSQAATHNDERGKLQVVLMESVDFDNAIVVEEEEQFEEVYLEHPHFVAILDPSIAYEVSFTYDLRGSIGSTVFSYSLSLFPTTYALFLWVFASQMNSWRKKDEFPSLLLTLRDESVLLAPFFIVIPAVMYIVFKMFGYTNPSILDKRGLFPDPFIDSFMLEQVPPFWSIPFLFVSSVCILTLLIIIVNLLFSIRSYFSRALPSNNNTRLYIGNFQLSFSRWLLVGTLLVVALHSVLGLLAFLLFLLVSPSSSVVISAAQTTAGGNTLLIKKKSASSAKSNSWLQRDLFCYQKSVFMMYLFAGMIMTPNLIVWIKHLSFEWQIFDSYELFILVAIAHICLSRIELNMNNLFLLRAVLIAASVLILVYAILLLYRVLHFTLLLSIFFIICHMWSLKEKDN
ncbi:hypothetical protein SAMD00019534_060760, partial [Acytostelium subglobosum LB1]|uniref:hypothetical protein n=1 Tax=Acytostelium subglobosum LB1 TaxID=1410327 RepID=UPI00064517FB